MREWPIYRYPLLKLRPTDAGGLPLRESLPEAGGIPQLNDLSGRAAFRLIALDNRAAVSIRSSQEERAEHWGGESDASSFRPVHQALLDQRAHGRLDLVIAFA
jgi:hypothetical protein